MTASILYSPEIADEICRQILNGVPLSKLACAPGLPSRRTVSRWAEQHPEFGRRLRRAREMLADALAEQTVTIADSEPDPQRARVRIQHRRWMAAVIRPQKWGERRELVVAIEDRLDALSMRQAALAHVIAEARRQALPEPETIDPGADPFS